MIPGIKIIAAGLYGIRPIQATYNIQTLVDSSLVEGLEDILAQRARYGSSQKHDPMVYSASQYTGWTMNPEFNIPTRAGIISNMVLSNITNVEGLKKSATNISAAEINLNIPAISVGVTCKILPLGVAARYHKCTSGEAFEFSFHCLHHDCDVGLAWDDLSAESGSESCSYREFKRFKGSTNHDRKQSYKIVLADFQNIEGPVGNTIYIDDIFGSFVEPYMFNVFLPTARSVSCCSNLTRITVDTTFSRKSNADVSSWNPIRVNTSTIRRGSQYINSSSIAPAAAYYNGFPINLLDQTASASGKISSSTLWPSRSSGTSFFELLAGYAEYKLGNLTAILDLDTFIAASEAVYTSYVTNMLTELRPLASNASRAPPQTFSGTITYPEARIIQNLTPTIVLECLLGMMLLFLLWVSLRFPNDAILPKNPGSIAATASLLANSGLVERLRKEKITSTRDTDLWSQKAALGWWPVTNPLPKLEDVSGDQQSFSDRMDSIAHGNGQNGHENSTRNDTEGSDEGDRRAENQALDDNNRGNDHEQEDNLRLNDTIYPVEGGEGENLSRRGSADNGPTENEPAKNQPTDNEPTNIESTDNAVIDVELNNNSGPNDNASTSNRNSEGETDRRHDSDPNNT
ncbi:uncharacterized protein K452DRAFT_313958 [Aplosporella prunicola CBS 121167]|uniref:Uncharacterized protein n=1 Tax=Aplosporella prunicola CBS 121167 TaxID=1176127 RepID=A0A6A6AWC7_9PEZI|nr:uncharacterized protein K452DRAFT_313958 [Aplosporella prunicola CBS 121167]KAF2135483.1 hypothetical protein K452DRAFT_313958 [Aplosporella prunicola CBS 121167]